MVDNAIASVGAKPGTVQLNDLFAKRGFFAGASNKPWKIKPIPIPTPDNAVVAIPAPSILNPTTIDKTKGRSSSVFTSQLKLVAQRI